MRFLWPFSRFEKDKCASGFRRVPGVLALARHYSTGPSEKQSFKGIDVAATNIVPMSVKYFFRLLLVLKNSRTMQLMMRLAVIGTSCRPALQQDGDT